MKKNSGNSRDILSQINEALKGKLTERNGETILKFNNDLGNGKVIALDCLSGLKSLNFNVKFTKEIEISLDFIDFNTVQFIFVVKGSLRHCNYTTDNEDCHDLNRFQNIIIPAEEESTNSFVFSPAKKTKVNIIFASKHLDFINISLNDVGHNSNDNIVFDSSITSEHHYGNYSLKIGDLVTLYSKLDDRGLIKRLSSEGYISLILANQLQEYVRNKSETPLPDTLTKTDVSKIRMIALYINDNITDDLTITKLSNEVTISAKKMQLGFKVLFSKSVNEYVRAKKLELAAHLIKTTDLTISEIVYNVGYNSRSYFSKIFFEYYGIQPNQYRDKFINKSRTY